MGERPRRHFPCYRADNQRRHFAGGGCGPSTAITGGSGFTAAIAWNGNPATFVLATPYTATVTLTANPGYIFDTGAGEYASTADIISFTVNGITPVWISNTGATLEFAVTFPPAAAPAIATITSAGNATVAGGTGGTYQVTATGTAPITFALSATAPAGVSINSTSGLITVAATVPAGVYTFTVTASNGALPDASQTFTLNVTSATTPPNHPGQYAVNIGAFTGGAVATNHATAAAGQTVTLTVSQLAGYELSTITVSRTSSPSTTVSLSGTGLSRSFTMPAYNVTVDATFAKTAAQTLWEQALAIIEAAAYNAPKSAAATEVELAAWLADYVNELLKAAGINQTVTVADVYIQSGSFTPAMATANGTFTFFVLPPNVTGSTLLNGTILSTVGNVKTDNYPSLQAWTQNGVLYVSGLSAGQSWSVYSIAGTPVYHGVATGDKAEIALPGRGVYIVTEGNATAVKVVN